ncbi:MAG: hypothetical protein A2103_04875 [Gammaproteobacteria bacterium GWF2_41_13]|nr:MAG: hypothetical protein A2103_04875 [Gammaproteobacteria bacterium GWF2_41_13]
MLTLQEDLKKRTDRGLASAEQAIKWVRSEEERIICEERIKVAKSLVQAASSPDPIGWIPVKQAYLKLEQMEEQFKAPIASESDTNIASRIRRMVGQLIQASPLDLI